MPVRIEYAGHISPGLVGYFADLFAAGFYCAVEFRMHVFLAVGLAVKNAAAGLEGRIVVGCERGKHLPFVNHQRLVVVEHKRHRSGAFGHETVGRESEAVAVKNERFVQNTDAERDPVYLWFHRVEIW